MPYVQTWEHEDTHTSMTFELALLDILCGYAVMYKRACYYHFDWLVTLASFPGPSQLSVACSTDYGKLGGACHGNEAMLHPSANNLVRTLVSDCQDEGTR